MIEATDQVTLVNDRDEVIGEEDKFVAHRHPAKLHRAISVWIVDEQGRLLIQQRSPQKIVGANWWGNTVCGNVWPGESYEDCAHRRLKVELGIQGVSLEPLLKFQYQAFANEEYAEHEMDQSFGSRVLSSTVVVEPNPVEAVDFLWVDGREFLKVTDAVLQAFEKDRGRPFPTARETVDMSVEELREWTPPLPVHIEGRELLIVPWTLVMSQFPEIRHYLGA